MLTLFLSNVLLGLTIYLTSQDVKNIEEKLRYTHEWIKCLERDIDHLIKE
tara:strand:- start:545 stop:694 length:150 start_codon:yes stop_codon:yes gene_type:complete